MATRRTKLKIDTEANTSALKKTAEEVRKVQKASVNANKAQATMGKAGVKASKQMQFGMQNASYQLQDVAVQAQMGTDKMRILAQQGPQLLSAFGPKGALAGLAVALGASLVSAFTLPKKSAEELGEEIEELISIAEKLAKIHFDAMESSLEEVNKRTQVATSSLEKLRQAQESAENQAQSAADAALAAELKRRELMNENVDVLKAEAALEQKTRAIIAEKEKKNSAIAAEQHGIRSEIEKEQKARDIVNEKLKDQLFILRQLKEAREEAFQEVRRSEETGKRLSPKERDRQKAAQEHLQELNNDLIEQDTVINGLRGQIETSRVTLQGLERQLQSAEEVQARINAVDMEASGKIALASLNTLDKTLQKFGEDIEAVLPSVEGLGTTNQGVMARLQTLLENGIQPQEVDKVITALQQLGVQLNTTFGNQDITINKIVDGLSQQQARILATDKRIDKLISQKNTKTP